MTDICKIFLYKMIKSPCWWGGKIYLLFPCMSSEECKKECANGSGSTVWDYTSLLCNIYWDTGPKCCHHSQTSCVQYPFNPFTHTWCNMFLTGVHHPPVAGILLLLPSNSSILPLHLPSIWCTRIRGNHHQSGNPGFR